MFGEEEKWARVKRKSRGRAIEVIREFNTFVQREETETLLDLGAFLVVL